MSGRPGVKTRYCTNCGAELGTKVNFCGNCGTSVEHAASASEPTTSDPPMAPVNSAGITATRPATNVMAIASVLAGVVWFAGLGSILAIFLGFRAKQEIRESNGLQTGEGVATAGITLGWIGIGVTLLALGLIVASSNVSSPDSGSIGEFERVEFQLNMDSALEDAASAEEEYAQEHDGAYTTDIPATSWEGVTLTVVEAGPDGYCVEATHDTLSETRYISNISSRPRRGSC